MWSSLLSLALLAGRPDIVLVTIDTLRADHVGAYGSTRGATPAIDRLAAFGVVVEDAVVQVPMTRPSHASIMTGLLPFQHRIRDNASPPLDRNIKTLATTLKAAGYSTAAFIGAYPVSKSSGLDRGFDVFDDPFVADGDTATGSTERNERPAREVLDAALAWLAKPAAGPRFVWLHFFEPHYPYEPIAPFSSRFRASPYDGEVATADEQIKRLLDLYPPTASRIVAVTSDHGEGLGDHGEDEHHLFVYDTTLRVPLIIAGGGLSKGGRVKGQFRSIDLMPTLLTLADVPPPQVTGVSRALNLKTGSVIPDNQSYAESLYGSIHFGYAPVRALRGEGFKYIDTPRAELYRVAADPVELDNLASRRASLSGAMQRRLRELHSEDARAAIALPVVDTVARERLAALGYIGGRSVAATPDATRLPDPKDRVAEYTRYSRGMNQALLARRRHDPEGVVRVLGPLATLFAARSNVGSFLGEALLELRRFKEAIPYLASARDASPATWLNWARLAEAYSGDGRLAEALDAAEKGLAVSSRSSDLIRLRATLLTRAGRPDEAAAFLGEALKQNPKDGVIAAELASVRRNAGDLRSADVLSAQAIQFAPQSGDAWISRGLTLGAMARSTDAVAAFARAREVDPRNGDGWFYGAAIEIQLGAGASALRLLAKAEALEPRRPGLLQARLAAEKLSAPPASGSVRVRIIRCGTRAAATNILHRIETGEDFATLAREVSTDASREQGGDLGFLVSTDLSEPLRTIVSGLRPGEHSDVVATGPGFLIVKRER